MTPTIHSDSLEELKRLVKFISTLSPHNLERGELALAEYTTTKINEAVEEARKETERQCFVYMEPGRIQDYKNRRDVTFQNDPRLSTNSRKGKDE